MSSANSNNIMSSSNNNNTAMPMLSSSFWMLEPTPISETRRVSAETVPSSLKQAAAQATSHNQHSRKPSECQIDTLLDTLASFVTPNACSSGSLKDAHAQPAPRVSSINNLSKLQPFARTMSSKGALASLASFSRDDLFLPITEDIFGLSSTKGDTKNATWTLQGAKPAVPDYFGSDDPLLSASFTDVNFAESFESSAQQQQQQAVQQQVQEIAPSTVTSSSSGSSTPSTAMPVAQMPAALTTSHDLLWQCRYKELQEFYHKYGHSCVPMSWKDNQTLAHWVKRQRHQYKLKHTLRQQQQSLGGRPQKVRGEDGSSLTDARERALEAIGFVWDSHSAAWQERWNELAQYEREHGHTNVPKHYPANKKLSVWVKCQRRQFKLLKQGQKSNMTQERIEKLQQLGFSFYPRRAERQQFWKQQQQQQQQQHSQMYTQSNAFGHC